MPSLTKDLEKYIAINAEEEKKQQQILEFVKNNPNCFSRENLDGHITSSGFLFNYDLSKVLLTHHKKLDRWLQLGGHNDGNKNCLKVALKEAREESGIKKIKPLSKHITDVDVFDIPFYAPNNVKEHLHYDIRYFLITKNENFVVSDESNELKWFTLNEFEKLAVNRPSLQRFLQKWKLLLHHLEKK